MAKSSNKNKKKGGAAGNRRHERRFSTSSAYVPMWVAVIGFLGSGVLGVGVFAYAALDPTPEWAAYLVAAGGLGLGVSLWFGQPAESSVAVGDSGIAVEVNGEKLRVPWFRMRSLKIASGNVIVEGDSIRVKFLLGANLDAAAYALMLAAERVPEVLDVNRQILDSLPNPKEVGGSVQDIEDDQVTGLHCAASDKVIKLEADARLCPRCGQIFHKEALPSTCTHCESELPGRALTA